MPKHSLSLVFWLVSSIFCRLGEAARRFAASVVAAPCTPPAARGFAASVLAAPRGGRSARVEREALRLDLTEDARPHDP